MRAFELGSDAQPVLRVPQITERDERRAAIRSVGSAVFERRTRDARLAVLEHFIGFDVASGAVQIRATLNEVVDTAGAERAAQHHTRCELRTPIHRIRIRAAVAQS